MSVLVRPLKRKLHEVEGLEQNGSSRSRPISVSRRNSGYQETGTDSQTDHSETSGDPHWFAPSLREATSNRASPICFDSPLQTQRKFDPHASIVLVGIRGTGKSSLAVMLAATSGRRLIDADRYFQQVSGHSRAAFKKEYGFTEYRQQEVRVMESMLIEHKEGCVIACGPGYMERSGQRLLREYAKTRPVVHILRDADSIQSYLKTWDTDKICRFLELSGPVYRACSNLEFFNVSEKCARESTGKDGHCQSQLELELDQRSQSSTPFLTLKRLQRDFLRFIALATGDAADLSTQHAAFPLSMIPLESRTYTYAVSVSISSLFERDLDIEDLETASDAFELKIDVAQCPSTDPGVDSSFADKISETVATIRRSIVVPFIYHVDSNTRSGDTMVQPSRRPENEYLNLVQHGLRLSPGLMTVDLAYDDTLLSQIIATRGSSQVIAHFAALHPLSGGWDGPEYMALYERARKLGCDMVRLSQPATIIEDNFAVLRFRHRVKSLPEPHLPLIAYNTGPLGRLSCCFNPTLTPVTHPSTTPETDTKQLPSITLREAQEALYASFTLDPMQFFVFGANVNYSLSPTMHNTAYKLSGMPHLYRIYQSPSLRGLNELVENPHFGGTSVSLPYKTEVIPLLHSMSPHARAIGAVNTLIPIRNLSEKDNLNHILTSQHSSLYLEKSRAGPVKALHGDNTDWIGICNCFRRGLSPANAIRPSSTGLVIGAGGMARAAVYAMIHLGLQNVFVHNRTFANAEKLAGHYNRQRNLLFHSSSASSSSYSSSQSRLPTTVHVLRDLRDPWPLGFKQPTVIASCIPAHSIAGQPAPCFEMPSQWLESPTGGVLVEVSISIPYSPNHQSNTNRLPLYS